jgi:hypothetical protein
MPLRTTTIGAYPKPDYVPVIDWFAADAMTTSLPTARYQTALEAMGEAAEEVFTRAAAEVIGDQVACGIDIPTDGEVRRENYIHYHCRHLDGFDFDKLTPKSLRQGAYTVELPGIVGPVRAREPFLPHDWSKAQAATDKPVKVTLPGMTVADTSVDLFYDDDRRLGRDLAAALNAEVRALADAGCRYIQIDEPLFARYPAKALAFGIEDLDRSLKSPTCAAAIPTSWTTPTTRRPTPRPTSNLPRPWTARRSMRSRSRTRTGTTTSRYSTSSPGRRSSWGWSPSPRAAWRARRRSASACSPLSATYRPNG